MYSVGKARSWTGLGHLRIPTQLPVTNPYRQTYENAAVGMIQSFAESYTTVEHPESNGILLHAVYSKPGGNGVDECCIWSDYFYFEALVRLIKDWNLFW